MVLSTYEGLAREPLKTPLLACNWGAVILDEAQRIRNPETEASQCCRRLKSVHRIALSGTPVQNSLTELWSLFDFVYPGRLGRLPSFEEEFALPIRAGGFKNATPAQVQATKRQAESLRLLVTPFLLRRLKKDVTTTAPPSAASAAGASAAAGSTSGSTFQKFAVSGSSSSATGRHSHASPVDDDAQQQQQQQQQHCHQQRQPYVQQGLSHTFDEQHFMPAQPQPGPGSVSDMPEYDAAFQLEVWKKGGCCSQSKTCVRDAGCALTMYNINFIIQNHARIHA